jgi:hypothetical protein
MVIGTKPRCVIQSHKRWEQLPKENRVEAMRPYIAENGLFPAKKDPATAPIRLHELKLLARRFNLNKESHFWKTHTSKEDIALALSNFIKRQKKGEEQRRGAHVRQQHDESFTRGGVGGGDARSFFLPDADELFGDMHPSLDTTGKPVSFEEGMIRMSRLGKVSSMDLLRPAQAQLTRAAPGQNQANQRVKLESLSTSTVDSRGAPSLLEGTSIRSDESDLRETRGLQQRPTLKSMPRAQAQRRCALALLNLTLKQGSARPFVEKHNLLQPLVEMMQQRQQETFVLECCLGTLINLLCEGCRVDKLIEGGVVSPLLALCQYPDAAVQRYTAQALLAMSRSEGHEEWLVQDGGLAAAVELTKSQLSDETRRDAMCAVVNLAVTATSAQADAAQRTVVRCLGDLMRVEAVEWAQQEERLCMAALAVRNLTTLDSVRAHLDDKMSTLVMRILSHLRQAAERGLGGHDRNVAILRCLGTAHQLAPIRKCRIQLADQGIIAEFELVLDHFEPGTGQGQACEISYTCMEICAALLKYKDVAARLHDDGVVPLLAARLTSADARTIGAAADGLGNLEDPTAVLKSSSILRDLTGAVGVPHPVASKQVLVLLGELTASGPELQRELVKCGILEALQKEDLCKYDASMASHIATILRNISSNPAEASSLVRPAVIRLMTDMIRDSSSSRRVRETCLHSAHNLSALDGAWGLLLSGGILDGIDVALESSCSERQESHCAAILYHLSRSADSAAKLVEAGGTHLLTRLAHSPRGIRGASREHCAAALCNLTLFCRTALLNKMGMRSLMLLADGPDKAGGRHGTYCTRAFAYLSRMPRGRTLLAANAGQLVPCLVGIIRSGAGTDVQTNCAISLCNILTANMGVEATEALVRIGAVQDLIAITLLRVNDMAAKESLARAIFNLICPAVTRQLIISQNAVFALLRLAKLQNPELNIMCARALRNLTCELSAYEGHLLDLEAEKVLMEQPLVYANDAEVKRCCAGGLANLSVSATGAGALAKGEIIKALRAIAVVSEPDVLERCAATLFNLTRLSECLPGLAEQGACSLAVHLFSVGAAAVRSLSVASIANLSCCADAWPHLVDQALLQALVETMSAPHMTHDSRRDALRATANIIVYAAPSRALCAEAGMTLALAVMAKTLPPEQEATDEGSSALWMATSKAMRDLCACTEKLDKIVDDGGVELLSRLARFESPEIKQDVATAICRLSTSQELGRELVRRGLVEILFWLTLEDLLSMTESVWLRAAIATRNVVCQEPALAAITADGTRFCRVLERLCMSHSPETQLHCAHIFLEITRRRISHDMIKQGNMVPLIARLVEQGDDSVQQICSTALNQLPQELVQLSAAMVKVLVTLLHHADEESEGFMGEGAEAVIPDPPSQSLRQWALQPSNVAEMRQLPVEASWISEVVGEDMVEEVCEVERVGQDECPEPSPEADMPEAGAAISAPSTLSPAGKSKSGSITDSKVQVADGGSASNQLFIKMSSHLQKVTAPEVL